MRLQGGTPARGRLRRVPLGWVATAVPYAFTLGSGPHFGKPIIPFDGTVTTAKGRTLGDFNNAKQGNNMIKYIHMLQ